MLGIFNDAYKFSDEKGKEQLKKINEGFTKELKKTGYYTQSFLKNSKD
jgi:hypothetical protein